MATVATETASKSAWPGFRAVLALFICAATAGLNTVDRNMFGLLLPSIREDIALSDASLGFLVGPAFVLVYSIAGVPLGWLADRTSRRAIIATGLIFWSLVTAGTGFATGFAFLLVARMALGVGEASNLAPTSALISETFEGRARVRAMAVFTAGGPLAIMAFFPMIGWIADTYSWRWAFPVMGAIGIVVAAAFLLVVREPPRRTTDGVPEEAIPFRTAAGRALRSRPFQLVIIGATLLNVNYSAVLAWLPTFMLRVHGLDAQTTGTLIGMYKGGLGVVATFVSGFLVAMLMRFDKRWLAWAPALCCLTMAPAQILLLLSDQPLWWHIGLAVETAATAAITPCCFALVLSLLEPRIRATGMAIFLMIFNLIGQSVGPMSIGLLNDGPLAFLGSEAVRYSMLVAPLAVVGSALFFAMLGAKLGRGPADESAPA